MNILLPRGFSRRQVLAGLAAGSLVACSPPVAPVTAGPADSNGGTAPSTPPVMPPGTAWEGWQRFASRFVKADGRVADVTFGGKTTSEGQSYGLFFALVAGERERFDRILRWTDEQLAGGALGTRLPGWLWGQRADGSWGLKDRGPASDADLWMAYTLLEAARLWQEPAYEATARALLAQIVERETVELAAGRVLLLPGPYGFALGDGRYRFNPSYLPGFLFRALGDADPAGPWARLWSTYEGLAPLLFPAGVAPDLCVVTRGGEVLPDEERGPVGSYDAIRVYLWAGLTGDRDAVLLSALRGFVTAIARFGSPPEKIHTLTGEALPGHYLPPGFAGAVLPFLATLRETGLLTGVERRVAEHRQQAREGAVTHYYDEALILFGAGWLEGRYRLDQGGRLQVPWAG